METLQTTSAPDIGKVQPPATRPPFDETKFFPRGAIAFFVVLVILGLIFWFTIYFLMLHRI